MRALVVVLLIAAGRSVAGCSGNIELSRQDAGAPAACHGCVDSDGYCERGDDLSACGVDGEACERCAAACNAGVCH